MDFDQYIKPLNMNGLNGRMLKLPSSSGDNKKEIMLLYGHHSSIERMNTFAEYLSRYGNVTMPDWPGFGGMDSLYKLNEEPTVDNLADYLAAFVKVRYSRKKVTIVAVSLATPIVVRMLQKYPALSKRVEMVVSVVGFVHKEDFALSKASIMSLKLVSYIGSKRFISWFLDNFILRPSFFRMIYILQSRSHRKMKGANKSELKKRIKFEIELWRINDLRTWFFTMGEMFRLDLCKNSIKLSVPAHHVDVEDDAYFDANVVEQHMKIIFDDIKIHKSEMGLHMPSVMPTVEEVEPFFPESLRKILLSKVV